MAVSDQSIASAILPSANHLELVRTAANSTKLLCWNKGKISTGRRFTLGSRNYVAADFDSHLTRDIRLARGLGDYQSAEILLSAISDVFTSYAGLGRDDAALAALFAIATHFPECNNPSLRAIVGAAENWDASRFLHLLACFCRHALTMAVFDRSLISRLPAGCAPSLLILDPHPSSTVTDFLEATQHPGTAMSNAGGTCTAKFTAVVLDCDRTVKSEMPNSFCQIDATPRSRPAVISPDTLRKIQDKFQAKLLHYRLQNWSNVAVEACDPPALSGSTRALASTLGSCFPNNPTLQSRVVQLLKPQDGERRFASACGEVAVVLEALLVFCHEKKKDVHIGEITEMANGILKLRGDGYQLFPRRVGSILKPFRLGHVRDSKGYKFLLSSASQRKIHELARSYDVSFFKGEIIPCDFCQDPKLLVT